LWEYWRSDEGGGRTEPGGEYTFFYGKGKENHELGTGFIVHKRITSAVKTVEFISDRMAYITLRGRWCDIIVLNVHVPTEDTVDDINDRFYEELEHIFDKFPKYHRKILLRDFNAKVGREGIFKPKMGMRVCMKLVMIMELTVVNFTHRRILLSKVRSHIVIFMNLLGHLQMGRRTIKSTIF
jgi:hypothetical protein